AGGPGGWGVAVEGLGGGFRETGGTTGFFEESVFGMFIIKRSLRALKEGVPKRRGVNRCRVITGSGQFRIGPRPAIFVPLKKNETWPVVLAGCRAGRALPHGPNQSNGSCSLACPCGAGGAFRGARLQSSVGKAAQGDSLSADRITRQITCAAEASCREDD